MNVENEALFPSCWDSHVSSGVHQEGYDLSFISSRLSNKHPFYREHFGGEDKGGILADLLDAHKGRYDEVLQQMVIAPRSIFCVMFAHHSLSPKKSKPQKKKKKVSFYFSALPLFPLFSFLISAVLNGPAATAANRHNLIFIRPQWIRPTDQRFCLVCGTQCPEPIRTGAIKRTHSFIIIT